MVAFRTLPRNHTPSALFTSVCACVCVCVCVFPSIERADLFFNFSKFGRVAETKKSKHSVQKNFKSIHNLCRSSTPEEMAHDAPLLSCGLPTTTPSTECSLESQGGRGLTVEKPGRHWSLRTGTAVGSAAVRHIHSAPLDEMWWEQHLFLPKSHTPSLTVRKTSCKSKLRDLLHPSGAPQSCQGPHTQGTLEKLPQRQEPTETWPWEVMWGPGWSSGLKKDSK